MMLVKRQGGCNGQKILSSFVVVSGRMASVASLVPVHVGINLEPGHLRRGVLQDMVAFGDAGEVGSQDRMSLGHNVCRLASELTRIWGGKTVLTSDGHYRPWQQASHTGQCPSSLWPRRTRDQG
jgi:hypothetical protein